MTVRSGRARRGYSRLLATAGLAATLGLGADAAAATTGSAATTPKRSTPVAQRSPLQQGLAFYRGKTIDFVCPGGTGAAFDLFARDIAPYIGTYLHATVNVTDVPQGATIPGQDQTEAATPDGLTIGELNPVGDAANALTHTAGLNFNPARVAFISSTGPSPLVLLATPSSGITSFAKLFKLPTPARALTQPTGTGPTITRSLMGVMHVPVNWLAGYPNAGAQVTGFLRGDGQLAWVTLSVGGPLIKSGVARPIAVTSRPPKGMTYGNLVAGAPTTAQLLKSYPPKTKTSKKAYAAVTAINNMAAVFPLFTQTGVAADKVDALRAAAQWAFSRSGLRNELLNQGQSDVYLPPIEAKQLYIEALKEGALLVQYILG